MNKRINELMDECGLWIDYDNREVTKRELEFFAEQIVRECLAECWYDATPKQIADRIREKFGVAE